MPEVEINIGGRVFEVACQEGEEKYLQAAAKMLDDEAQVLAQQIGRIPESRMLLMAGLMLADKTAGMEDRLREMEARLSEQTAELEALRAAPAPEPERIEVPVVPQDVTESLAELAARAEALADEVEEKVEGKSAQG
ncbi:cell division protein ZapA [Salinihabitans flavidus]|uniref:Cell division protein ZapA n=1 Tax=Salinihabitans flavidus TaxID=569882 RepID=A0A1H8NGG7_9RHOB|nr:cell division protein ZapA [Salinihabitans flavidus]SEO28548.1 cell division protein ZapA [Salinihabitans flavidus]